MPERVLIDGIETTQLDVMDRGLQYGDGLFETIALSDGQLPFWSYHWQRLRHSCQRLNIPLPDKNLLEQEIASLINNQAQGVVKLILTRGRGERGYVAPAPCKPTRILMLSGKTDYPPQFYRQGVRLYACQTRLAINPALAGMKHLNRLEQVLARNEWQGNDYQEGLLLDVNGHVIECCMSNIFWVNRDCLYTPDLSGSGVAGVMREIVMQLAKQKSISIKMGLWSTSELVDAEEIFITNSLIGIWPVSYILNKTFQAGPVTQQLQSMLQAKYAI